MPVLPVKVSSGYDFAGADLFLRHLDDELPKANPGAVDILRANGVDDIAKLGLQIQECLTNKISLALDYV